MGSALKELACLHAPTAILLCCPACGNERLLREAEGLPRGVSRLIALCPECEGHGADASLLMFEDGRVQRGFNQPPTQDALPLHGAGREHRRTQTKESIARG